MRAAKAVVTVNTQASGLKKTTARRNDAARCMNTVM